MTLKGQRIGPHQTKRLRRMELTGADPLTPDAGDVVTASTTVPLRHGRALRLQRCDDTVVVTSGLRMDDTAALRVVGRLHIPLRSLGAVREALAQMEATPPA